jgi:hypothetical protein
LSIGEIDLEVVSMSDGADIQALEQFAGHPFQNWMFGTLIQMIVPDAIAAISVSAHARF